MAALSCLRPGLALDAGHGPEDNGFESQLRAGFVDALDDGEAQRGEVHGSHQVIAGERRAVADLGVEHLYEPGALELLAAQALRREVADGASPLVGGGLRPRLWSQEIDQPASQPGHAERVSGGGQRQEGWRRIARGAPEGVLLDRREDVCREVAYRLAGGGPQHRRALGPQGIDNWARISQAGERQPSQAKSIRALELDHINQRRGGISGGIPETSRGDFSGDRQHWQGLPAIGFDSRRPTII